MPMDRSLYPDNWEEIALKIKQGANWTCENCGKQCKRPNQSHEQFMNEIATERLSDCPVVAEYRAHPTRWVLTVAHLNHQPEDCRPDNLRPWCAPCHLRYDNKAKKTKRHLKREREGQLSMEVGEING